MDGVLLVFPCGDIEGHDQDRDQDQDKEENS